MTSSSVDPPPVPVSVAASASAGLVEKGRQWCALVLICAGIFSALSIWFSASAVLEPLLQTWNITNTQGSFLTSFVNLGFCCGCLASAMSNLADKFAPQLLILVGSVGAAASNLGMLLDGGYEGALLCRFLVGMFLSLVYPPGVKLLSTWFSAQDRGTALGIMFGAFCLGSAFPQLLRGVVARHSWRPVVVFTSSASALSGLLVGTLVKTGPFAFPRASSFSVAKCAAIARNRPVTLAIIAYCGHMWELFCVWAWAATFLERTWRLPPTSVPLVAFAVISMGGPGSWIGGRIGDRFGRVRVAVASLVASGLSVGTLGLLAHEGPLAIRIILFSFWGLTGLSDSPQFSVIITVNADQQYVGTAVTVQLLCGYLTTVLALWVVPRIADEISWRWSFFSLTAGPAVSILALFCIQRSGRAAAAKDADGGTGPVEVGSEGSLGCSLFLANAAAEGDGATCTARVSAGGDSSSSCAVRAASDEDSGARAVRATTYGRESL